MRYPGQCTPGMTAYRYEKTARPDLVKISKFDSESCSKYRGFVTGVTVQEEPFYLSR
jgi:hypothetical protein